MGAVAVFLLGLLGLFPLFVNVAGFGCFVEVVVEEGGADEHGDKDYFGGGVGVYFYADEVEKSKKEEEDEAGEDGGEDVEEEFHGF